LRTTVVFTGAAKMAGKKKDAAVSPDAGSEGDGGKAMAVRMALPPRHHRLLRVIAAYQNRSMADLAPAMLMKAIDAEVTRLGIATDTREPADA
jgi:hypothetical protein